MAILHCRQCGGDIESDARRTQCRQCGALFPFECVICQRNLRTPFPIYEDERYLTLKGEPQPLCCDHFLRKCPDCSKWFHADENPGFFRCASCAEKMQGSRGVPEWDDGGRFGMEPPEEREVAHAAPLTARGRLDSNTLVLAGAGFAFLALVSWYLLAR